MANNLSVKHLQISRANVLIVVVVSVACFVSVFALVTSFSLLGQRNYQARVISTKEKAKQQLAANITARDQLVEQYKLFVDAPTNIIGGTVDGASDRTGDNARIILDALPSKYDYPALASSIEKLVSINKLTLTGLTGVDDELNQATAAAAAAIPAPVDMPFTVSFTGDQASTQQFLTSLMASIRPIQIQQVTIAGTDEQLSVTVVAKTYYQPEKTLQIKNEVVK